MKRVGDIIPIFDDNEYTENPSLILGEIIKIRVDAVFVESRNRILAFDTIHGLIMHESTNDSRYIDLLDIDIPENPFKCLKSKMENEGFHYCFTHYSDWKEVEDDKFQKLKEAYQKAAKELENYILEQSVFGLD